MNAREHARWARALIKACGGLEKAAHILEVGDCSRSTSQLSNYQNADAEHFSTMPAQIIQILEEDVGRKIYSRALFEYGGEEVRAQNLREEVYEATESVVSLQREVRLATTDGKLTPNEVDRLAAIHREATEELRDVGHLLSRGT